MKLYHGTNTDISTIDLSKSLPYKDFGKGFYLTDNKAHAANMAKRRVARYNGTPMILEYEFDIEEAAKHLDILKFDSADKKWATFVMANRNYDTPQPFHNYDIVIGPIADDDIATSMRLFQDGFITIESLVERLKFKELSIQYFFHTEKSLQYLHKK